jgi:hypothetical protein
MSPKTADRRRFPPPWTVEETQPCFIVRDANKQALAFVSIARMSQVAGRQASY